MIVGPSVVLSGADCSRIVGALITAEARARRNGRQVDPETLRITREIIELANAWRRPPAVTNLDGAATGRATSSAVVTPLPPGRVMTVEEVASRLGLSSRQARRLAASGRLAGRKIGTTWIVDEGEVEREARARDAGAAVGGRPGVGRGATAHRGPGGAVEGEGGMAAAAGAGHGTGQGHGRPGDG